MGPGYLEANQEAAAMNHREYFDQIAAEWDELLEEETLARLREIVAGHQVGGGGAGRGVWRGSALSHATKGSWAGRAGRGAGHLR